MVDDQFPKLLVLDSLRGLELDDAYGTGAAGWGRTWDKKLRLRECSGMSPERALERRVGYSVGSGCARLFSCAKRLLVECGGF